MNIKRFFAPDMRRAICQVRSEHGPDAVILSSQSVDGGVEIIAAGEYDETLVGRMALGFAEVEPAEPVSVLSAAPDLPPVPDPELQIIHKELRALKGVLCDQFARLSWADLAGADPCRIALLRRAEALGFERSLAETLIKEVVHTDQPDAAWRDFVFSFARRIQVIRNDPLEKGGVFALVGPTGVGKTTTIAKLAARHCLRFGSGSLALITTDSYRIGGHRQLDAFGAILGVPVRRADTDDELQALLGELSDRRLILVDTAGMAPRDSRVPALMRQLEAATVVRRFLVLSANMQGSAMRAAASRFGGSELSGVVLTKLDEADGLGAALSMLISERLPVAWLSEGQRVPEDLKLARAVHLIKWATEPREEAQEELAFTPHLRDEGSRRRAISAEV